MKAKTVTLETYNNVKGQVRELKYIAEQRAEELIAIENEHDRLIKKHNQLVKELDESKKVAEVFKNKYQALNQAVKAMANANDNLLFKC